eukprot:GHVU01144283.1.p1 GENE.GHVU01144283.1~~GHVU01144283.1.p1  ORF type:complete len:132 (+),score=1.26 GHVU01144283.1:1126-1521(+)
MSCLASRRWVVRRYANAMAVESRGRRASHAAGMHLVSVQSRDDERRLCGELSRSRHHALHAEKQESFLEMRNHWQIDTYGWNTRPSGGGARYRVAIGHESLDRDAHRSGSCPRSVSVARPSPRGGGITVTL